MFLRSSQYQRQARFQTSGNCTVQKRIFGSQKDRFQQIHVQSQNCYEMGFCVQVVRSGRASIKSNQVKKKKEKRKKDTELNPCNQFSHEENFLENLLVPL